MEYIPADDISIEYAKASEEKKSAVTNLLRGEAYLSVVAYDERGESVTLDWQAGQALSVRLVMGIIMTGRSEFGRIWLDDLKTKISQLT